MSWDLPQHAWDLAKATGQDDTMDSGFVHIAWDMLSQVSEDWWTWQRSNGHYGPPVAVSDDASLQDRLLGLLGRDPKWTPARP